jgi:hypothetical protein
MVDYEGLRLDGCVGDEVMAGYFVRGNTGGGEGSEGEACHFEDFYAKGKGLLQADA